MLAAAQIPFCSFWTMDPEPIWSLIKISISENTISYLLIIEKISCEIALNFVSPGIHSNKTWNELFDPMTFLDISFHKCLMESKYWIQTGYLEFISEEIMECNYQDSHGIVGKGKSKKITIKKKKKKKILTIFDFFLPIR